MAATYTFPDHTKGDTLNPIQIELKVNGVVQNLTGMVIECMFKSNPEDRAAVLSLSSEDGGIEIIDAELGLLRINPGIIDIDAGTYYYDMQFTFATGEIKTLIKGTLTVIQDITYVSE